MHCQCEDCGGEGVVSSMQPATCNVCNVESTLLTNGWCNACESMFMAEWAQNEKDMRDNGWNPLSEES